MHPSVSATQPPDASTRFPPSERMTDFRGLPSAFVMLARLVPESLTVVVYGQLSPAFRMEKHRDPCIGQQRR
jgi:hypothetical protein